MLWTFKNKVWFFSNQKSIVYTSNSYDAKKNYIVFIITFPLWNQFAKQTLDPSLNQIKVH